MFAKSVFDWAIFKSKKYGFSVHIGTWSNSMQSLIDCLAYLTLHDKTKMDDFLKDLTERNETEKWFTKENRIEIREDIKKNELNYNAFVNVHDLDSFIEDLDNRYIDESKIDDELKNRYTHLIECIVLTCNDIKDLYHCIQTIKETFNERIIDDIYEFTSEE